MKQNMRDFPKKKNALKRKSPEPAESFPTRDLSARPPEKVIREEKEKLEKYEDMLDKVSARLAKVAEKAGR